MRKEPPKKPVGNKADRGGPGSRSVNARNVRSANQGEKLPSIDRANPTFDYIDNAIHEYLMKRQLYHTLEVFKDELNFVPKQKANIDYQSETELIDVNYQPNCFCSACSTTLSFLTKLIG